MAALSGNAEVTTFVNELNTEYDAVHKTFEDHFWATKMNLAGNSVEGLSSSKNELDAFLSDPGKLDAVRKHLDGEGLSEDQIAVLKCFEKTFKCYIMENPQAVKIRENTTKLEGELAADRNKMALGYKDPKTGEFVKASSVQLRTTMGVSDDEALRKACYDGVRTIGPAVAEQLVAIVKGRNKLAKMLGYEDFYDYKVTAAEGFGKAKLFEMLDGLEARTSELLTSARAALAKEKGEDALKPWNTAYAMAGSVKQEMDPYFPFEDAVDVWARTFAALDIKYQGSVMNLDLCDRDGKYSNGFCHWPQCAWRKGDGSWVPAVTNFTSLASPNAVGSGYTALNTLLHEGGHAAHFANVDQYSPLFAQERAPTSVAYAENQSMYLDSYVSDAAWLARYAKSTKGETIPWELVEKKILSSAPYEVFMVRAMLAVPYFEKALYEMSEDELTVDALLKLADDVETKIQGGPSARPLMSVPHILADESCCYYHGYVLAEMSVHQTRAHFKSKYGSLIDNPAIGKDLAEIYWKPGNGASFLDLVDKMTGSPLAADAWVAELNTPLEKKLAEEKADYDSSIKVGPKYNPGDDVDLGMVIRLVHGDEVIADTETDGGLGGACAKFKAWVRATYFKE